MVESRPKNSMIVYAAEAGNKAEDGLFTPTLASVLAEPGLSLSQALMKVRRLVSVKSGGSQTPGEYSQLFEDVFLASDGTSQAALNNGLIASNVVGLGAIQQKGDFRTNQNKLLFPDTEFPVLGKIQDPDGYTNVRKNPSIDSEIICSVKVGDLILVHPDETAWWKVKTKEQHVGFMHKSRIILDGENKIFQSDGSPHSDIKKLAEDATERIEKRDPPLIKREEHTNGLILDEVSVDGGRLPSSSPMGPLPIQPFLISRYPITWSEWKTVREWADTHGYDIGRSGQGSGGRHPVRNVSWYEVIKWCNAKSEKDGLAPVYYSGGSVYKSGEQTPLSNKNANGYRLPTEAEWEWAARGGIKSRGYKYSGSDNIDEVAWYWDNSSGAEVDIYQGRGTWPVGLKKPNELGLFDMSGNIWEWCWDTVHASYRALRGGRWSFPAERCAISYRANYGVPSGHADHYGFRTIRSIPVN